jgi:hypothetical protein
MVAPGKVGFDFDVFVSGLRNPLQGLFERVFPEINGIASDLHESFSFLRK